MPTNPTHLDIIPVLPLRDVVVYPHMVVPLFVGRAKSITALEAAMKNAKQVFLVAQTTPEKEEPTLADLCQIGTVSTVLQLLRLPDGSVKVLVEGNRRGEMNKVTHKKGYFSADIALLEDIYTDKVVIEALVRTLLTQFDQYVKINKKVPPEILPLLSGIEDAGRLADAVTAHMVLKMPDKQKVLEAQDVRQRLELVTKLLKNELELLQIEKRIQGRVRTQMEKTQREYYLNEKIKAIQQELGEEDSEGRNSSSDPEQLKARIKKAGMNKEAKEKALSELAKMRMMPSMSAEATVIRNYLDWLLTLPWKRNTKAVIDLKSAEDLLNKEHYGLEKIKERIIEFLAVHARVKKVKGPILCLVGPPGVGKTSLGQSIANAIGRNFVRLSLGGVRDEAEIRGHRRTYIGSMPGRIIQYMAKVKVTNPVFMLDEVDKMAADFRGDPASALLEVLDPEQNNKFNDHYLEVDYDLSDVMFIATANSLDIPPALLDRMEVIRIPGYTEFEKLTIAERYLVPRQLKDMGLKSSELTITTAALRDIIRYYTREAGVRALERGIAKVSRKVVKELQLSPNKKSMTVTQRNVDDYLGVRIYTYGLAEKENRVGQVIGLAWTEVGGELLRIEAVVMPGKGKTTYTGRLGNVMQESIQAALTVLRSRVQQLGLKPEQIGTKDIHVHVPEGATPKDGPSAGIGMCTALVSAFTTIPVHADVAMTGEITLGGEVLPIGGLKEKLLAALRGRVRIVIIPEENVKDLKEISTEITQQLDIRPVKWIEQVLEIALVHLPKPLASSEESEEVLPLAAVVAKKAQVKHRVANSRQKN